MKKIFIILLVLYLSSCITNRFPSKIQTFKGIIKTCILDSTSLTQEPIVKIINSEIFINSDCVNKPKSYEYPLTWPSGLYLDFNTQKYTFQYSPIPYDKKIEFTDKQFRMSWNVDIGKLKYNKQKEEIILTSIKYKWERSFKISFSINKDTLILTAL